jgi:hypothetical protein
MGTSLYSEILLADDRVAGSKLSLGLTVGFSILIVAGLAVTGRAQLLRVSIPLVAALIGLVLYLNRPVLFLQYALWVWFLVPLVRRLVDWRFGFVEQNYVLLAPFLVSAVAGLSLLPPRPSASIRPPMAFVLCGASILYGFVIGMLAERSAEMVFGLVNWLTPMIFGLHVYLNWPRYEQYKAAITRTFLWALVLMGLYGIYQYVLPPAWDRYWLENVMEGGSNSFGRPEPFEIRVWSTMNSPGPFANTVMAGLLLLFAIRSPLKLPSAVAGYLSFLLSVVRAAWLSWVVGFISIMKNANPRVIFRAVLSLALLIVCLVPLVSDPRVSTALGDRFKTFTDLGHDESAGARMQLYRESIEDALRSPFGYGLKTLDATHGKIDSGILTLVFSLGWLGGIVFVVGLASLLFGGHTHVRQDDFANASRAIALAILAQIVAGAVFVNVTGALFWIFGAMYLAAQRYHAECPTQAGLNMEFEHA